MRIKAIYDVDHGPTVTQFKWKIPDFSTVIQDKNVNCYQSQYFEFINVDFVLKLHPRSRPFSGFMMLCLAFRHWYNYTQIEYSYGFEKQDGSVEKAVRGMVTHANQKFKQCVFKLSEMLERQSELAPLGVVTIICKLKQIPFSSQPLMPEEPKRKKLEKLDTLSENFSSLFANEKGCDVTLQVMDKVYKAHSTVLMARSSVFAHMFQHENSKKQTGVITRGRKRKSEKMVIIPGGTITIPDCYFKSFELFLKFLYSGETEELSIETALDLYKISNKYNVLDLKALCTEFLNKINFEKMIATGTNADKCHDIGLFYETTDFVCHNENNSVWYTFEKREPLIQDTTLQRKDLKRKRAR